MLTRLPFGFSSLFFLSSLSFPALKMQGVLQEWCLVVFHESKTKHKATGDWYPSHECQVGPVVY